MKIKKFLTIDILIPFIAILFGMLFFTAVIIKHVNKPKSQWIRIEWSQVEYMDKDGIRCYRPTEGFSRPLECIHLREEVKTDGD